MKKLLVAVLLLCAAVAHSQTTINATTVNTANITAKAGGATGINHSAASHTIVLKVGLAASKPALCTQGEMYFAIDATAGQNLYECTATNTWTQQINTGGAYTWSANQTFTAQFNAGGATRTAPAKVGTIAGLPGTCTVGDLYFATDATAGSNIYGCTTTNVWSVIGGSGYNRIQEEASNLTQRSILNFTDSMITAVDNAPSTRTDVSLSTLGHTRQIIFLLGADNGAALSDTDDQASIYVNRLGSGIHVTEVWCESDAGSPIIQIQKDDGTATNMLSANLTCTTGGASTTGFVAGEDAIANTDRIDFVMVTAGGTAKRVTVAIKATID